MENTTTFMWSHFVVLMEKINTSEIGRYVAEIHAVLVFEWISC